MVGLEYEIRSCAPKVSEPSAREVLDISGAFINLSKAISSPGAGMSGTGGISFFMSASKANALLVAYNLCQREFEIAFLSYSSIMMRSPSLPAKKMNGIWQLRRIMNET